MVLDLFFFLTLTLRNVIIFLDATIIIYVLQKNIATIQRLDSLYFSSSYYNFWRLFDV